LGANKLKSIALGLAVAFAAILLSFLALELIFRIFSSKLSPKPYVSDRPRLYFFDQQADSGRDLYYPEKKDPKNFRIMVFGDSFSFGPEMHFDDTFSKRMERSLNLNQNQTKVEVINFGQSGFSTRMEAALLKLALPKYDPDLVILQITLNDPELKPYRTGKRPNQILIKKLKGLRRKLAWSKFLQFVVTRVINEISVREFLSYYHELFNNKDTYDNFRMGLNEVKQLCDRNNKKLVAVLFPLFGFPLDDKYPFSDLHQKTHELLESLSINYLDLYSSFAGMEQSRLQIEPGRDSHPNEIAHRIATEVIMRYLRREHLLPKDAYPKRRSHERKSINLLQKLS